MAVLLADAVIVNYSTRIKDIFQEHGSDKDILFSTDYGGQSIINAGVAQLGLSYNYIIRTATMSWC